MKILFSLSLLFLILLLHSQPHVIVLGVAQDGGFPHIGCQAECQQVYKNPSLARYVTSLALVDPGTKKWWMLEASPDMDDQLQYFQELTKKNYPYLPEGIFITHAHMGHYAGLLSLGREALGGNGIKVYALPRLIEFLKTNGPWSQLVELDNIEPIELEVQKPIDLGNNISINAFTVPHRDEFSETAGFNIQTKSNKYIFIPDIDKWSKWNSNIVDLVKEVDYAFLDATFFEEGELPNRAMSEVPHPFVSETMKLFEDESLSEKSKIHFIHFNHTNPLLFSDPKKKEVLRKGFEIAEQGTSYN